MSARSQKINSWKLIKFISRYLRPSGKIFFLHHHNFLRHFLKPNEMPNHWTKLFSSALNTVMEISEGNLENVDHSRPQSARNANSVKSVTKKIASILRFGTGIGGFHHFFKFYEYFFRFLQSTSQDSFSPSRFELATLVANWRRKRILK